MANMMVKRVMETRAALEPVLKKLGLKPNVRYLDENSQILEFVPTSPDGKFSPVRIIFEGKDRSWENAHLSIGLWGCRVLGQTGFVSWKKFHASRFEVKAESEGRFEHLAFVLEHHEPVPAWVGVPNCIVNPNFGDHYELVSQFFKDAQIEQRYQEGQETPVESFRFRDESGRDIEISMRLHDSNATLRIDGRFIEEFYQLDREHLVKTIRDLRYQDPYPTYKG
ncbi:hypothetical protein [Rhizobium sp. BG4]|uniref:hypothetical protein n=1 Tax=Rhizobium sp. BG4 TaxID=2613770 RepID=UPI00193E2462|nr:hypothetical protein [Rhizobium sp. BG4]QRM44608.1 hypothetical protein F2982_14845 [Rhizobium sp. BG4]